MTQILNGGHKSVLSSLIAMALIENMKPGGPMILVGDSGQAPIDHDNVPHYYSKKSQERLARAEDKRERKKLKRLKTR